MIKVMGSYTFSKWQLTNVSPLRKTTSRNVNTIQKISLRTCSDLDWTNDSDNKRSLYGTCIFVDPNLVSWRSKKKLLVVYSSVKEKYTTLAHTIFEVLWLELYIPYSILRQSKCCSSISKSCLSWCKKHIELEIHFVRERVVANKLIIQYVLTSSQLIDV